MNNYLILSSDSEKSNKIEKKINNILTNEWVLDESNPKYIFIVGGDGTFLRNLEKINKFKDAYVVPINGGNFGFYSHFNIDNINSLIKCSDKKEDKYYHPLLINVKVNNKTYKSINEVVLNKNKTLMVKIEINGIIYEKFIGSGILISTPTGSTGRSKSAGGSVIFPNLDLIQLMELEPINQKGYNTLMSPIILDKNAKIKITILNEFNSEDKSFLTIDGNKILNINKTTIEFFFEKSNFFLYKPNDTKSYIKKLRKAFISGG